MESLPKIALIYGPANEASNSSVLICVIRGKKEPQPSGRIFATDYTDFHGWACVAPF